MKCRSKECFGWIITGNEDYAFAVSSKCDTDIQYFTRDPETNNDAYIRALGWAFQNPPDNLPDEAGVWWREGDTDPVTIKEAETCGVLYFVGLYGSNDRQPVKNLKTGRWYKIDNPWK